MMENKLAYLSIDQHLKTLRFTGFFPLSNQSLKVRKLIHDFYRRFASLLIPMYIVQQSIKVYQVRDDLDKVVETAFLLLTNSDAVYKHLTLWKDVDKIEELIKIMKGPIFNQDVREHELILSKTVRFSRIFLKSFIVITLTTCILWIVYPIILFIRGTPSEFMIWLPFDTNTRLKFYSVILYTWFQTSFLAINNLTMDGFIYFLLVQCKTQLVILRLDLENLVQQTKDESKCLSIPYHELLKTRFHKLLQHYNEIEFFFNTIAKTFSGPFLYQFLVSGWIICTTAYRAVNINPVSVEFASMILYMFCILSEIFLFCHFGNDVAWESACLLDSAYMMDWLELPISLRKDLIIFMERLKKPLLSKAGLLIPLSLTTFVSIMRSSYSFFVLLQNSE